jgi:enhancing lycopene biosynthesis protein 2
MKKIAVILSGCGVYDGAEIHEAMLTLLAISRQGAAYEIFAPDIPQHHVINHLTGEEMDETRNVLVESARIARGKIRDLKDLHAADFDGLVIPGRFGVVKNLSTWAFEGGDATILPDVERSIQDFVNLNKPLAALCIAPVILAKVLGEVRLTVGKDEETIQALETIGARHTITSHGEVVVDQELKVITTPCYMLEATIAQIAEGAENAVKKLLELTV